MPPNRHSAAQSPPVDATGAWEPSPRRTPSCTPRGAAHSLRFLRQHAKALAPPRSRRYSSRRKAEEAASRTACRQTIIPPRSPCLPMQEERGNPRPRRATRLPDGTETEPCAAARRLSRHRAYRFPPRLSQATMAGRSSTAKRRIASVPSSGKAMSSTALMLR